MYLRTLLSLIAVFAVPDCHTRAEEHTSTPVYRAESDCFVVQSYQDGPVAGDVLSMCSTLRDRLRRLWLAERESASWQPRCQVVLHATRNHYAHAVGRGAANTSGSSLIRFKANEISERRIDILVDSSGQMTCLPHELTHVVLADRFAGREPPRWADEGLAMLADTTTKQSLHDRDCVEALRGGTMLRIGELVGLQQFNSPQQVATFYGQSLSLTRFLVERDDPARFLPFVELATVKGYDQAIKEVYGIDGLSQLERLWHRYALAPATKDHFAIGE